MLKRNCVHYREAERPLAPGALMERARASHSRDLIPHCDLNKMRRNDCPARCDGYEPRSEQS